LKRNLGKLLRHAREVIEQPSINTAPARFARMAGIRVGWNVGHSAREQSPWPAPGTPGHLAGRIEANRQRQVAPSATPVGEALGQDWRYGPAASMWRGHRRRSGRSRWQPRPAVFRSAGRGNLPQGVCHRPRRLAPTACLAPRSSAFHSGHPSKGRGDNLPETLFAWSQQQGKARSLQH
jgi:hypothetical protein